MTKFLDTYKGADIYEVNQVDESKGQKLGFKLMAKGTLPKPKNMAVDFVEEAQNLNEALKKIRKDIDQCLNHHDLTNFDKAG